MFDQTSGSPMLQPSRTISAVLCSALLVAGSSLAAGPETREFDVVVYGATAGGVTASIAAAREGCKVALLEPRKWVGGMVSGGLGATDFGKKYVIGGLSLEFFERVGKHYKEPVSWFFEPHVAEKVFNDWLKEAGVRVFLHHRVAAVEKKAARITRITMENGDSFSAKVFVDASYEGDLLPRAGISYTVGREAQSKYGESLAGRIVESEYHQFKVKVSPFDENGKLLPFVYGGDPTEPGQGDRKVQAYNFRLCITRRKHNQVPFPKPANYDPKRYELLRRYLNADKDLQLAKIISIIEMPNGKTDINNNGAFSTDHIGGSWEYPEADYAKRQAIWDDHVNYVQGFFYFVANDPGVPKHLQEAMNQWGLAKDEFVDNNHWPHQLYIREARRMIGQYVMIQKDLQTERSKPDSIGMGSYNSDSHHVQRIPTPDGAVTNEGDMQVPVQPYEIAYRAITPKAGECENLLVPVCPSASHVAFSSMRMEPVYMIMGHSAGVAAALAIRNAVPVQNIDVSVLQRKLREQRQILSLSDTNASYMNPKQLPGVVVDNDSAVATGSWNSSTSVGPFVGTDYLHDNNAGKGEKSIRFVPSLSADGKYEILISYTPNPNRATNVPVTVQTADGAKRLKVNQRQPPDRPPFRSLGIFRCKAGPDCSVEVTNADTDGFAVADAVQWLVQP